MPRAARADRASESTGRHSYKGAGELLRMRRKELGFDRRTVAGRVGVDPKTLDNWEMGNRRPRRALARKLIAVLWREDVPGAQHFLEAAKLTIEVGDSVLEDESTQRASSDGFSDRREASDIESTRSHDMSPITNKLRGPALNTLLSKGVSAVLRRGVPIGVLEPEQARALVGERTERQLEAFRHDICQTVSSSDLEHHSLAKLHLYLVGDDSFVHLGWYSGQILIVCQVPGCADHQGMVLCQDERMEPQFAPSRSRHYRPGQTLRQLEKVHTVIGHVLGVVRPPQRRREVTITGDSMRSRRIVRIGLLPTPDAFLLAWCLERMQDGRISQDLQCVMDPSIDHLRNGLVEGRLDLIVAPRYESDASSMIASQPLYVSRGNRLYVREGSQEEMTFESIFSRREDLSAWLPRLLQGASIALGDAPDERHRFAEFLRHHLSFAGSVGRDELETLFQVNWVPVKDETIPVKADLLWCGPIPPQAGWVPVTHYAHGTPLEVWTHRRSNDSLAGSVAEHLQQALMNTEWNLREIWKLMSAHLDVPMSLQDFRTFLLEAITPVVVPLGLGSP